MRSILIPSLSRIRRSSISGTMATNGLVLALGLAGSVQLARVLGPDGRGEIAAAMLWPTLLTYLGSLGLISSVVYHAALPESDAGTVFGTAALLAVGQSVLAIGIGWLLLPTLLKSQSPEVVRLSRVYLWVVPFNLVGQYAMAVVQARMRFRHLNALRLIVPVGYLAAIVVLTLLGRLTPRLVVVSHFALSILIALAAAFIAHWLGLITRARADLAHAKRMLVYGAKVHAGTLSQAANLRVDQALISAWFPPAQLGLYVAAVSAASINQVIANAVDTVLLPRIAGAATLPARAAALRAVFARFVLLSLAGSTLLAISMPFALPFVFGAEFAAAIVPAILLVVATFFLGLKDVLASGARAMGNPWLGSRAEILASVVMLITMPALLPVFGLPGAAAAAMLTNATQLIVVLRGLHSSHSISTRSLLDARAVPNQ